MTKTYHIRRGDRERGPFSELQLRELARQGKLRPNDLVTSSGSEQWVACSSVPNLFPETAAVNTSTPSRADYVPTPPTPPPVVVATVITAPSTTHGNKSQIGDVMYSLPIIFVSLICCAPVGLVLTVSHPHWSHRRKALWCSMYLVLFVTFCIIGAVARNQEREQLLRDLATADAIWDDGRMQEAADNYFAISSRDETLHVLDDAKLLVVLKRSIDWHARHGTVRRAQELMSIAQSRELQVPLDEDVLKAIKPPLRPAKPVQADASIVADRNSPPSSDETSGPIYVGTLLLEFKNEATATKKYEGRIVDVVGTVERVEKAHPLNAKLKRWPWSTYEGQKKMSVVLVGEVHCYLVDEDDALDVHIGRPIVIQGVPDWKTPYGLDVLKCKILNHWEIE